MSHFLKIELLFIIFVIATIPNSLSAQIIWDTVYNNNSTNEYYLKIVSPVPCENQAWYKISNTNLDSLVDKLWIQVRNEKLTNIERTNAVRNISLIPTLKAQSLMLDHLHVFIATSNGVSMDRDLINWPFIYYSLEYGVKHDIFSRALLLAISREQDDEDLSYLSYIFEEALLSGRDSRKIIKEKDPIFFKNLRKIMELK